MKLAIFAASLSIIPPGSYSGQRSPKPTGRLDASEMKLDDQLCADLPTGKECGVHAPSQVLAEVNIQVLVPQNAKIVDLSELVAADISRNRLDRDQLDAYKLQTIDILKKFGSDYIGAIEDESRRGALEAIRNENLGRVQGMLEEANQLGFASGLTGMIDFAIGSGQYDLAGHLNSVLEDIAPNTSNFLQINLGVGKVAGFHGDTISVQYDNLVAGTFHIRSPLTGIEARMEMTVQPNSTGSTTGSPFTTKDRVVACITTGAAGSVTAGSAGAGYGAMGGTIVLPGGGTLAGAGVLGALGATGGGIAGCAAGLYAPLQQFANGTVKVTTQTATVSPDGKLTTTTTTATTSYTAGIPTTLTTTNNNITTVPFASSSDSSVTSGQPNAASGQPNAASGQPNAASGQAHTSTTSPGGNPSTESNNPPKDKEPEPIPVSSSQKILTSPACQGSACKGPDPYVCIDETGKVKPPLARPGVGFFTSVEQQQAFTSLIQVIEGELRRGKEINYKAFLKRVQDELVYLGKGEVPPPDEAPKLEDQEPITTWTDK